MLRALELVGFKSFADKTRFEFPSGITVVVGPNGSGKSNVVDAIKWVLGEQSVKSLRGKEMADVIFNGSSSRRPIGSAEATLTFDNSQRLLAIDAPEVHITRRVYRGGEGEYLINRQACRLRDIRDLFAGTGMATEAYSVIEQGKVDILLQSSPKERRLIFEEAAGISRFKTKKVEAARRLERVDQNLLRLSDIVEEVENRLRGVRLQAAKARRYKDWADRLQLLRTHIGWGDWQQLSTRLQTLDQELALLQDEVGAASAAAELAEAQALAFDLRISESDQAIEHVERARADNREQIAALESGMNLERRALGELEEELARRRRDANAMQTRAGGVQLQLRSLIDHITAAETESRAATATLADAERMLTHATKHADDARSAHERLRAEQLEQLRTASQLTAAISRQEAQFQAAAAAEASGRVRLDELSASCALLRKERDQSAASQSELESQSSAAEAALDSTDGRLATVRGQWQAAEAARSQTKELLAAAGERAAVLNELEQRLEGLGAGVRQILSLLNAGGENAAGAAIHGLSADLLHVNVDNAPLVEVALGDCAQYLVVETASNAADLLQAAGPLAGRMGFIARRQPPANLTSDLSSLPGVRMRASDLVETSPEFESVARQLLGGTWIVENWETAQALADRLRPGERLLTLSGALLKHDGSFEVGPRGGATGLVSRKSELRAIREQIARLKSTLDENNRHCEQLQIASAEAAAERQTARSTHEQIHRQLTERRARGAALHERIAEYEQRMETLSRELFAAADEHSTAALALEQAKLQLTTAEEAASRVEHALREQAAVVAHSERQLAGQQRETGVLRLNMARCEQQLDHLRLQLQAQQRDQQERGRLLAESQSQVRRCADRLQLTERTLLGGTSAAAELYLLKEGIARKAVYATAERERFRAQKSEIQTEAQRARTRLRKVEASVQDKLLAAGTLRHERTAIGERLREDYGIDLSTFDASAAVQVDLDRAAVEQEIAELRGRLGTIGGVNLDALSELEELETRFHSLSAQYADLSNAKTSLEQIIGKINADSRRLFADTLEVVREHFQSLFRKLFGGGQADIVLEEAVDILESGIEIVARPPGKEPRNISLLSGGEKTLTCVALLLAIFRSRPSPFCVLDEVDAALDEANIERFVAVLQEFLAWTQFIVVTHSKKTMTCASTLYGVTMQESGVSKRVSVRFEDVSDDGQINSYREVDEHDPNQRGPNASARADQSAEDAA